MSNSAGETPKNSVYIPPPSKEPFLMINVREGASIEEIVAAVDVALRTVENPFFQYDTPLVAEARERDRDIHGLQSPSIPIGKALNICLRQEGW